MHTIQCQHCGRTFGATSSKARYCSPDCAYFGNKIARLGTDLPATYEQIPNYCDFTIIILQECGPDRVAA